MLDRPADLLVADAGIAGRSLTGKRRVDRCRAGRLRRACTRGEESRLAAAVHNVVAGSCASSNAFTAARADTAMSRRRSMRAANPAPS